MPKQDCSRIPLCAPHPFPHHTLMFHGDTFVLFSYASDSTIYKTVLRPDLYETHVLRDNNWHVKSFKFARARLSLSCFEICMSARLHVCVWTNQWKNRIRSIIFCFNVVHTYSAASYWRYAEQYAYVGTRRLKPKIPLNCLVVPLRSPHQLSIWIEIGQAK